MNRKDTRVKNNHKGPNAKVTLFLRSRNQARLWWGRCNPDKGSLPCLCVGLASTPSRRLRAPFSSKPLHLLSMRVAVQVGELN